MISTRTRALLDRYTLASKALSVTSGERSASEVGQSVEFYDFRQYQPGDELRYVDWKVYGRTGRLYTRLFQAERTMSIHVLLDTSASMGVGNKARYGRILAQLLSYVAQLDARCQVHLFDSSQSLPATTRAHIPALWEFIEAAPVLRGEAYTPATSIQSFALSHSLTTGAGLVLVISDLLDEMPLRTPLVALRAKGFDVSFLQVMADEDLSPSPERLQLIDAELGTKLTVNPDEVSLYRERVRAFLETTRATILQAGFRHVLLTIHEQADDDLERQAFAALIREGMLIKR
ncbi:MAG: DUF58 domain-containing protein [Deinococcota bacterium]